MADTSSKEQTQALKQIREMRGTESRGPILDFIHFLLDYDIIGYTSAFIIAVSGSELFNSIGRAVVKSFKFGDVVGDVVENLVAFLIVVFLVFLVMYYVIQPIVASRAVQEERKVKEVVKAAEEKEIKKEADKSVDGFGSRFALY